MFNKLVIVLIAILGTLNMGIAQDMSHKTMKVKNVTLEQTKGEFSVQSLTLAPGDYQFEIVNNNVGSDVGFVVAPTANPEAHLEAAYVTELVKNNSSQKSGVVNLKEGEYIYFCPLNKTPQYQLTVR